MRPDYCPVANEPCQCVCIDGCRIKKNSRQPLSAEKIEQLCYDVDHQVADHPQTWKWTEAFARAIEAAHGITGDSK